MRVTIRGGSVRRSLPFFDYPALFRAHETEFMSTLQRVLASGKLILQEDLERFERNLADYLGVAHAFGVGNGTDALLIALRASGVGPGDEVILPSHTFVATASAVHHAGAKPVLVDVGDDHVIDPDLVERAVGPATRAIMPVQLNGRTCDMDALRAIADRHGLIIVEDAAQGLGSEFRGRKAGTFGKAAGFSFYPAKLLGCFGDGGAVVTNDPEVARRVAELRNHGRTEHGDVSELSYNSRLDNLQAAILDLKLATFEDALALRRRIASIYHERLLPIQDLRLPPAPDADPGRFDVFQNYEIEAPGQRDELRAHLSEAGIGTIIQWGGKAVHQFSALGYQAELPVTERIMRDSLLLPMHAALTEADAEYVAETVASFFVSARAGVGGD
jgi:dTDP-4-amino-4,6-dideoxygalactose transaminase